MPLPTSDAEILAEHHRAEMDRVHKCVPGFVVAYNATSQTADVRVATKIPLLDEDGAVADYEELPIIPGVNVGFPRGGGFVMAFPLDVGDSVILIFTDQALGEWRDSGDVAEPADVRRHGLSGAFCIPGGWPTSKPPIDASKAGGALVIGRDGASEQIVIDKAGGSIKIGAGATDFAALASKVDDAVATIVSKFNLHTHVSAAPGALTTTPASLTGPMTITPDPDSVAAALTKVQ